MRRRWRGRCGRGLGRSGVATRVSGGDGNGRCGGVAAAVWSSQWQWQWQQGSGSGVGRRRRAGLQALYGLRQRARAGSSTGRRAARHGRWGQLQPTEADPAADATARRQGWRCRPCLRSVFTRRRLAVPDAWLAGYLCGLWLDMWAGPVHPRRVRRLMHAGQY